MKYGDKNIFYFYARATTRKQVNKIRGLRDELGNSADQKEPMEAIANAYFHGLFTSTEPNEGGIDEVLQSLEPRMTEEANHLLSQLFTTKEVIDAISGMSHLKSPSLDGFLARFY